MGGFYRHPTLMIARMTFLEARHNKVLHIAGLFAAALIFFSLFMGQVSLFQNEKVVKDAGLACISFLGVFIAIFLGVNSLYQDLEKRTIYTIISKPITRPEIMFGKFVGMCFVLTAVVVSMTIYLYLITSFMESKVDWYLLPAIGLMLIELFVVAAIAVFFSSFSSPFLSGFFSAGVFLVGRLAYELGQFGERSRNEVFRFFATGVRKVLDFEGFNLRTHAVHKLPIYVEDFWYPAAYGFFLILLLLLASYFVFSRRDFK